MVWELLNLKSRIEEEKKLSDSPLTRVHYYHRGRMSAFEEALKAMESLASDARKYRDEHSTYDPLG